MSWTGSAAAVHTCLTCWKCEQEFMAPLRMVNTATYIINNNSKKGILTGMDVCSLQGITCLWLTGAQRCILYANCIQVENQSQPLLWGSFTSTIFCFKLFIRYTASESVCACSPPVLPYWILITQSVKQKPQPWEGSDSLDRWRAVKPSAQNYSGHYFI